MFYKSDSSLTVHPLVCTCFSSNVKHVMSRNNEIKINYWPRSAEDLNINKLTANVHFKSSKIKMKGQASSRSSEQSRGLPRRNIQDKNAVCWRNDARKYISSQTEIDPSFQQDERTGNGSETTVLLSARDICSGRLKACNFTRSMTNQCCSLTSYCPAP